MYEKPPPSAPTSCRMTEGEIVAKRDVLITKFKKFVGWKGTSEEELEKQREAEEENNEAAGGEN